jgi:hypothetical protein
LPITFALSIKRNSQKREYSGREKPNIMGAAIKNNHMKSLFSENTVRSKKEESLDREN